MNNMPQGESSLASYPTAQGIARPYAIDGHRSCISKQAQADRKKRNKAAARARKRNRG